MITFTAPNGSIFEGVTDEARDKAVTKTWQMAIAAVRAGSRYTITGGQCEAEGCVVVTVNQALWFYAERVIVDDEQIHNPC